MRPRRALQIGSLTVAGVCACVAASAAFAPADPPIPVTEVCFEGRLVKFEGTPARGFTRWFRYGPWQYGARGSEKPDDKNPNLYLLVPGSEHHSDAMPQFDHTAIISTLAKQEEAHWDVYWAVVLDPDLTTDFRDERQLLIEAQKTFTPRENFQLGDVPGREVLTRNLKVENVSALERFRRNDGKLPRVAIVPAGISVRGTVTDPAAQSAQK